MRCPCRYCLERVVGCHAACERYAEYRKKYEALHQEQDRERIAQFQGQYTIADMKRADALLRNARRR